MLFRSANGRVVLFGRKYNGTFVSAAQQSPNGAFGGFADIDGGPFLDYPVAATGPTGVLFLFSIGIDGVLYVRSQASPGAGNPFGPWQALPS